MSSNSTNSLASSPVYEDLVNLLGMYEKIALFSSTGVPGYSNVEIGNYVANLTLTMQVGTTGIALHSYGNLAGGAAAVANAIYQNL